MAAKVARLGAEAALRAVCAVCGPALWTTLPTLWDVVSTPVTALAAALEAEQQPGEKAPLPPGVSEGMGGWPADQLQGVVNAMRILEVVGPSLHPELSSSLAPLVTPLLGCCTCANSAVRESASKALAALASAWAPVLMPPLLRTLVPMLSSPISRTRLGAVCVTAALVSTLGARLVSYAVLLVVPLLRRMSDSDGDVRARASACFGALVALLPLAQGQPLPPGLDSEQLQAAAQDSTFLMQVSELKCVQGRGREGEAGCTFYCRMGTHVLEKGWTQPRVCS
jgi:TATA-binding protein-associated factor